MKMTFLSVAFLALACTTQTFAQKAPKPDGKKEQSIIIHRKGDAKEKTTIVIDGDDVTINGKPLSEYKGDVDVIEGDAMAIPGVPVLPGAPHAPIAPMPPEGGVKMFTREFRGFGNNAVLGVASSSTGGGASVTTVTEGSAAEKAGLKKGDVITKVGTTKIGDAEDLVDAIGDHKPEDKVDVTYTRDGKQNTVAVTLQKNKMQAFSFSNNGDNVFRNFGFDVMNGRPRLGMRVQDIENGTGVTVLDIDDNDSPAAKAGLKEDDVIQEVNGKTVGSVKDIKEQLADVKPGDDVTIKYQRNGASQTAKVHLPKPLQTSDL